MAAPDTPEGQTSEGTIHFICQCGKKYVAKAKEAGRTITCKQCRQQLTIPSMLELTASPDIPAQYDEGKQATRPLLYFKCDACDLTQAISEEEAKNVVRCRLCGNEIHRSKKTPSGVTPTKVSKLCITAEVDERRAVVHFVSSEVTQPHEVEVALKEIQEVADQFEVRLLVINFTHVPHPSSSFLGKLIALYKRLSGEGIQLRLCCMSLEAENIYKIMNLAKLAPLYATEEAALKE